MTRFRLRPTALTGFVLLLASTAALSAQTPAPAPGPQLDFSGVIFGNYQYRTDSRAKDFNKFDLERIYLTFRMPAGDRTSIRVTTDVFQNQNPPNDSYYAGWMVRIKYGYLQYNYLTGPAGRLTALARVGMLHTVVVDHEEQFWPRWISQTAHERAGLGSSADMGVATLLTLPNKWGEIYGTITNGPGYTSRELDRFKDGAVRLSFTPLANNGSRLLSTLAISPWIYKGATASRFVAGGVGQVGPVGEGMDRDRWGVFAGIRDPWLTLGAHYISFSGQGETGLNTLASPRAVFDTTGNILSLYGLAKPLTLFDTAATRLGIVARFDKVTTNTTTDAAYHVFIGGLTFDISRRATLAFDYQEQLTDKGTPAQATQPLKTYFAHFVANF
jgi:hypothetical protein